MINTLYLPELREMLADGKAEELREFCTALHAARTAEFVELGRVEGVPPICAPKQLRTSPSRRDIEWFWHD